MQTPDIHRSDKGVQIRPAASLLIIRDVGLGLEVLALKRSQAMRFLPGHLAFPGGSVDAQDNGYSIMCSQAPKPSPETPEDHMYRIAALRECAEETGMLCAIKGKDPTGNPKTEGISPDEQELLLQGTLSFTQLVEERGCLALNRLHFIGRWITPPGMPARFDTRFYLYGMPEQDANLTVSISERENEWARWESPSNLLNLISAGTERAMVPTVAMLQTLASFSSVAECLHQLSLRGAAKS